MHNEFLNPFAKNTKIKDLTLPYYAVFNANNICESRIALLIEELLHRDEKIVIAKRKKITAKKEYIASRFLIKSFISQYLNIPYKDLQLSFDQKSVQLNAMYHNSTVAVNISLAHSKGFIFFAITRANTDIGIDIEFQNQHRDTQALIKAYFHPDELSTLLEGSKEQFYQYWALKEALAKITKKTILEVLKQKTTQQLSRFHHISFQYQQFALAIVQTARIKPQPINLINFDEKLQLNYE